MDALTSQLETLSLSHGDRELSEEFLNPTLTLDERLNVLNQIDTLYLPFDRSTFLRELRKELISRSRTLNDFITVDEIFNRLNQIDLI